MKKKIKIASKNVHEYLHREPSYIHPRLKFIPNVIINAVSFVIAVTIISVIIYFIFRFLIKAFYHL